MATNIITVTATPKIGPFNTAAAYPKDVSVSDIKTVVDATVVGQTTIKALMVTSKEKFYTTETRAAIKALANA